MRRWLSNRDYFAADACQRDTRRKSRATGWFITGPIDFDSIGSGLAGVAEEAFDAMTEFTR
jgi:hypothetical protein